MIWMWVSFNTDLCQKWNCNFVIKKWEFLATFEREKLSRFFLKKTSKLKCNNGKSLIFNYSWKWPQILFCLSQMHHFFLILWYFQWSCGFFTSAACWHFTANCALEKYLIYQDFHIVLYFLLCCVFFYLFSLDKH